MATTTTIIPMTTAMAATEPATALLQTLWLASPTLPVGGFSYSEGLEAAVDAGTVHNESSAALWLIDQLHLSLARSDLAVVAAAIPAWQAMNLSRIHELNTWVLSTRETQEFRLQTEQMGRSLQEWARNLGPFGACAGSVFEQLQAANLSPPTYPVAMACAIAASRAPVRDGLMGYAFGWADNLVQAAIKAVPLGQSAGQRILARLVQDIPSAVDHALSLSDDTRQAFTPLLAILSARHEIQYSRLFRS